MEKLTLKELAPYLPYNLMVLNLHTNMPYKLTGRVIDRVANLNESHKPILRPLSDLTKEIEHNSISVQLERGVKKVVPTKLIKEHYHYTIRQDGHFSYHLGDGTCIGSLYNGVSYGLVQLLIEWHFDIFGLLDKNLAVPVTEEFNPYK